jgi:putative tricarboxylic transport membrane protein
MTATGALGYLLRKFDFETAPIVLGLILAPMMEMSLRQSLAMSSGSYTILLNRPIAATLLFVGLALLLLSLRPLFTGAGDWRRQVGLENQSIPENEEK